MGEGKVSHPFSPGAGHLKNVFALREYVELFRLSFFVIKGIDLKKRLNSLVANKFVKTTVQLFCPK